MNVTRLDGALLDFWVAKSAGLTPLPDSAAISGQQVHESGYWDPRCYHPSSNWSQGGQIVADDWYQLEDVLNDWFGTAWPSIPGIVDEPLKWLMRAYVATKFGNEVEEVEGIEQLVRGAPAPSRPRLEAGTGRAWSSWFFGGSQQ